MIAGLVQVGLATRVLLHGDPAALEAATAGPPLRPTVRKKSPPRPRLQGAPQRQGTRGKYSLRDLTWVASAVLRDGATIVEEVKNQTGHSQAAVRLRLRRLEVRYPAGP